MRGERVPVSESCTLERKRDIRARAWREEGGLHGKGRGGGSKEVREGKQQEPS